MATTGNMVDQAESDHMATGSWQPAEMHADLASMPAAFAQLDSIESASAAVKPIIDAVLEGRKQLRPSYLPRCQKEYTKGMTTWHKWMAITGPPALYVIQADVGALGTISDGCALSHCYVACLIFLVRLDASGTES